MNKFEQTIADVVRDLVDSGRIDVGQELREYQQERNSMSNDTKWTPSSNYTLRDVGRMDIRDQLGLCVATVFQTRGEHRDNVIHRARLIAAAPDLYEVLEEIEDLPVNDCGERTIPPGFLDKARAKLAKARGGAS